MSSSNQVVSNIGIIGQLYNECIQSFERDLEEQGPADFIANLLRPLRSLMPTFYSQNPCETIGEKCLDYYNKLEFPICPSTCCSTTLCEYIGQLVKNNYLEISDVQKKALNDIIFAFKNTSWKETGDTLRSEIKKFDKFAPEIASRESYLLQRIQFYRFANCGEYASLYNYFLERNNCFHTKCSIDFSQDGEIKPWHTFNIYIQKTQTNLINNIFDQSGVVKNNCSVNDIIQLIGNDQGKARIVDGWFQKDGTIKEMLNYYTREYIRENFSAFDKSYRINLIIHNNSFHIGNTIPSKNHQISFSIGGILNKVKSTSLVI